MKHGKRVWGEDDCTPGTDGHETLQAAWQRLFRSPFSEMTVWCREDVGDGEFLLMENDYVVFMSYPGNNIIYEPAPVEAV